MIHSLCSQYHWSFDEALNRTVPQIIMLNYSAHREYKNAEKRAKAKAENDRHNTEVDPFIQSMGVRRSDLEKDSHKWSKYYSDWTVQ